MAKTLFTLGYEGLSQKELVARLAKAGVDTVLDVRELPLSHKPGFSKRGLAEGLAKAGIGYAHLPELGAPRAMRHRYRADGDAASFRRAYKAHLTGKKAALADVVRRARSGPVCLVCFEKDYRLCHRSVVAKRAAELGGLRVVHLPSGEQAPAARWSLR
jgi:uncharacterized protein (DUF488 family)